MASYSTKPACTLSPGDKDFATFRPSRAHPCSRDMRAGGGYLFSRLELIPQARGLGGRTSIRNREKVGESMNFTVVRAVRGSDLSPPRPTEVLGRVSLVPPLPGSPAPMDLPFAEEVLHLEIGDFPETIPGALE